MLNPDQGTRVTRPLQRPGSIVEKVWKEYQRQMMGKSEMDCSSGHGMGSSVMTSAAAGTAQDRQGWSCQHSLMDCGRAQEVPPLLDELWAVNGLLGQGNTFLQWYTHWQVVQSLVYDLPPRLVQATIIELHMLMTQENKNPCLDVRSIKK